MIQQEKEAQNKGKYAVLACFTVVIFVIMYKYMLNVGNAEGINDLKEHMWHAEQITKANWFQSWLKSPYFIWHICVNFAIVKLQMPAVEATAFICGLFAAGTSFVTFFVVEKIIIAQKIQEKIGTMVAFIASALTIVAPLYLAWESDNQYLGVFSVNPMHNPTHMAVKPFGILAFAYAVDLFLKHRGKKTIFTNFKNDISIYVLFSIMLLLVTLTKPTFTYMLLPAGGLYFLFGIGFDLYKKNWDYEKSLMFARNLILASLPAIIYLFLEFAAFYFWGGTDENTSIGIYPLFYVWKMYSDDIPNSIILAMCFPCWMVCTNIKYFLSSVEGKFSMLAYGVGFMEFSLFVETGHRIEHANFAWCMMSGMLALWIVAAARLVTITYENKTGKIHTVNLIFSWILFMLHLFAGLYSINPYMYII